LSFPSGFRKKVKIVEVPYNGDVFSFWRRALRKIGFDSRKSMLFQIKDKMGIKKRKSFLDFVFTFYNSVFAYPDKERGWREPAIAAGQKVLEGEKFDAIMSTSSPVTAHVVAGCLKNKNKLPWLADFRDLWTQNHDYPYFGLRKIFEEKLEVKTLCPADALITVSEPLAEKLEKMHKKSEVCVISNGFFEEEINKGIPLAKKFTIIYAGAVYAGKQDPKCFFSAVRELVSEKVIASEDVEIKFYTGKIPWLEKEIEDFGLGKLVKVYDKVSRPEIMKIQGSSQILLILDWEDREEKGWISLKIFGYLASLRPILAIGGAGENAVEKMLFETKSGCYAKTENQIKKFLSSAYLEYKKTGRVSYKGDLERIKKHSYKEKARGFAAVLNRFTPLESPSS